MFVNSIEYFDNQINFSSEQCVDFKWGNYKKAAAAARYCTVACERVKVKNSKIHWCIVDKNLLPQVNNPT